MSTLSIAPSFAPQRSRVRAVPTAPVERAAARSESRPATRATTRPASVRLTRRGQVVVVVALLGLALALMTVFGGFAAATRHSAPATSVDVVTVAPGDTLFGLAGRVSQPGHVREMVRRIQDLNSLDTATLQPGQQIAVPRG